MAHDITNQTSVELGIVPTHAGFVGGLVPDDHGNLPRTRAGQLVILSDLEELRDLSRVTIDSFQMPLIPGTSEADLDEIARGLEDFQMKLFLVLMVGGADPMNPADESVVLDQLLAGLAVAKKHGVTAVASTSIECWMMDGASPRNGAEFEKAVAQNAKLHNRAYNEAGLADSSVQSWDVEFLRPGEFQTFTDLGRLAKFLQAANQMLGATFFRSLTDAAHCGDSSLTIPENEELIAQIGARGELGCFHASAKTTRGCLSTDDGWIGALLAAVARTGALNQVFVELFTHTDPALQALRDLDPGHGIDTTDGRSYNQCLADGLADIARRLNNLKARGILQPAT
jgi:hypothetical protein